MAAEDSLVDLVNSEDGADASRVGESVIAAPSTGQISTLIGTGKHADKNIVFYIIKSCLLAGFTVSGAVLLYWMCKDQSKVPAFVDVWHVFGPFITLALGYLFGKKSD